MTSVTAPQAEPPSVLASRFVSSLTIGVIDRNRCQRNGGDVADLCVSEVVKTTNALHDPLDRRVVRPQRSPWDAAPVARRWSSRRPTVVCHRGVDRRGGSTTTAPSRGGGVCPLGFLFWSCLGLRASRPPLFLPAMATPCSLGHRIACAMSRAGPTRSATKFVEVGADEVAERAVDKTGGDDPRTAIGVCIGSHWDRQSPLKSEWPEVPMDPAFRRLLL